MRDAMSSMDEPLYPVAIIATRYGGTYEGGAWAAFPLDPWQVPTDPFADDMACAAWWEQFAHAVGVGDAPATAWLICRPRGL